MHPRRCSAGLLCDLWALPALSVPLSPWPCVWDASYMPYAWAIKSVSRVFGWQPGRCGGLGGWFDIVGVVFSLEGIDGAWRGVMGPF